MEYNNLKKGTNVSSMVYVILEIGELRKENSALEKESGCTLIGILDSRSQNYKFIDKFIKHFNRDKEKINYDNQNSDWYD